ncbi:AAA family ATPase [Rhodohalobacter sp. 8-1]|uniref:AAA family ATPase n=1 Tax=Rhodohalobacter sp. 8-1 TaxID=3131972 RepID=UPI0030EBFD98
MQHETDADAQLSVESTVRAFIETDLTREIQAMRLSFRQPLREWFAGTRDELLRLKKDDEKYYERSVKYLADRLPNLKKIIESLESDSWHSQLEASIKKASKSLPEEMTEEQLPDHLNALEEDSFYVKAGKFLKRIKQKIDSKPPKRTVFVRQLFLENVAASDEWIKEFAATEYDECTMLLDLLLEKTEQEKEGKSNEEELEEKKQSKKKTDFKFQIFVELEEHLHIAVQHLKQVEQNNEQQVTRLLEPFAKKIISKSKIAGTFQLSQKRPSAKEEIKLDVASAESCKKQQREWVRFLMSQFSDLKVQVEIAQYGFLASETKDEIANQTHEFFRDSFYIPIDNGIKAIESAMNEIGEMKASGKVGKKLDEVRLSLKDELDSRLLEHFQDAERVMSPVRHIQNLLSDLQAESRHFSDKLNLATRRESKYPVPAIDLDTIRWQSLAARFLNDEAVKKLDPTNQQFNQLFTQIKSAAEEAVQVVDVNIQAATEAPKNGDTAEKSEKEQAPLSISLEGLERAISSLEKAIKEVREKHDVYKEIVETRLPTALNSLAAIMLRRDFSQFELQDKALFVKEHALDWKQKLSSKWAILSDKVELGWRFAFKKIKLVSRFVAPYLGFKSEETISTKEKRNLAEDLAKPGAPSDLPFVYKRLFDRDFSIDERFYVSPSNGLGLVSGSFDQWSRGLSTNVAIVGEKGSGKTTLIRFVEKKCINDETPVVLNLHQTFTEEKLLLKMMCDALGFKPVETTEEFIEKVQRKKNRSVIVVENLQNAFIRNINGFKAIEAFWVIMSSTMDELFWIVSCSRYSWDFFIKIANADQYFSHITYTDRLDEEEIREAIMTRHKSSGYELYFEPDESIKNSRAYKKLLGDEKESQELIRNQYFSKLYKVCEGNTSIAMIFWLQSIKEIDKQRFVFQPLEITDIDKLEVPSTEVLFTLAALVQHDMLDREQVAHALHQSVADSSLMLARLKTKGIIYEGSTGYKLNHLVYRQIIRMLKRKNIIH